jgi:hypothetical protein
MAAITDIETAPGKSNWRLLEASIMLSRKDKIYGFKKGDKPATKVAPVAKQA